MEIIADMRRAVLIAANATAYIEYMPASTAEKDFYAEPISALCRHPIQKALSEVKEAPGAPDDFYMKQASVFRHSGKSDAAGSIPAVFYCTLRMSPNEDKQKSRYENGFLLISNKRAQ